MILCWYILNSKRVTRADIIEGGAGVISVFQKICIGMSRGSPTHHAKPFFDFKAALFSAPFGIIKVVLIVFCTYSNVLMAGKCSRRRVVISLDTRPLYSLSGKTGEGRNGFSGGCCEAGGGCRAEGRQGLHYIRQIFIGASERTEVAKRGPKS